MTGTAVPTGPIIKLEITLFHITVVSKQNNQLEEVNVTFLESYLKGKMLF